jgi:hypothetical protein
MFGLRRFEPKPSRRLFKGAFNLQRGLQLEPGEFVTARFKSLAGNVLKQESDCAATESATK